MDHCPVVPEGRTSAWQIRENTFLHPDIDELRNGLKSEIPELLTVAAENLAWIVREKNILSTDLTPDIISLLIAMLGNENWNVRKSSMKALSEFITFDKMRNNIAQHFLELIHNLNYHNEHMRENSVLLLSQLADYGDLAGRMAEKDILDALVQMFSDKDGDVRFRSSIVLSRFTDHSIVRASMVHNALDLLVQILKGQKRGVRLRISWVLVWFAIGGVVGAKVIKADVHESLIWMLKSQKTDMRRESLWVLSKLVNAKYDNRYVPVFRKDIVDSLVGMLKSDLKHQDRDLREQASSALVEFAKNGLLLPVSYRHVEYLVDFL